MSKTEKITQKKQIGKPPGNGGGGSGYGRFCRGEGGGDNSRPLFNILLNVLVLIAFISLSKTLL